MLGLNRMDRVLAHRPLTATLAAALALGAVAIGVVAPAAAANVPPPMVTTNPVRVPAMGNTTDGILTTNVTYGETSASATASTGATISLGKGWSFRLRTCVGYHLDATPPASHCAERSIDTRANTDSVFTYAPRVTLPRQQRPTTEPWGYFVTYTEVLYLSGSSWLVAAHSWPDDGLQTAGIAVAPQSEDFGTPCEFHREARRRVHQRGRPRPARQRLRRRPDRVRRVLASRRGEHQPPRVPRRACLL
jgi:hypothetical protein